MKTLIKILMVFLLVSCTSKPAVPDKPLAFTVKAIRTFPQSYTADFPQYYLFTHHQQLKDFLEGDGFVISGYENSPQISELMAKYDEDYFEANSLALLLVLESSGSIRHQIDDVKLQEKTLHVTLIKRVPTTGTTDMANWSIFIELDRVLEDSIELEVNTTSVQTK